MSYQIKNVALTALNQAKLGEFHMATATQAAETKFNESIATLYARYKALCTTYSTLILNLKRPGSIGIWSRDILRFRGKGRRLGRSRRRHSGHGVGWWRRIQVRRVCRGPP